MKGSQAYSERTQGFTPREISALTNTTVLSQHASEAAFLFTHRSRAVSAAHYKLKHLAKLDARLLGHLRGLQIGGRAGFKTARALLGDLQKGAIFVTCFLAFGGQGEHDQYQALQLALTESGRERELMESLGWLEPNIVRETLIRLSKSDVPAIRRIGLEGQIIHHIETDTDLERAARDEDPLFRALAFKAIGENNRKELRITAELGLRDAEAICRFWAGWSLAMQGDAAAAIAAYDVGRLIPSVRKIALEMAIRCGEQSWAREVVRHLAASASSIREAIKGVGMFGAAETVPWLLDQMKAPENSRVAGEAFSTITGADLKFLDLALDPSPSDQTSDSLEDSDLPWPDVKGIQSWWTRHRGELQGAPRYLCGYPISADSSMRVLIGGYQRQRAMASMELALHDSVPVFGWRARSDWQLRRLVS